MKTIQNLWNKNLRNTNSSMIPEKLQNVTWAVDAEKLLPNIELLQGIDYSTEDNTITKIG
jgi:hypothetical protein